MPRFWGAAPLCSGSVAQFPKCRRSAWRFPRCAEAPHGAATWDAERSEVLRFSPSAGRLDGATPKRSGLKPQRPSAAVWNRSCQDAVSLGAQPSKVQRVQGAQCPGLREVCGATTPKEIQWVQKFSWASVADVSPNSGSSQRRSQRKE